MLILNKDKSIQYTNEFIASYYRDKAEYCVIDEGNYIKGPMVVIDKIDNIIRGNHQHVVKPFIGIGYTDDDSPCDEFEVRLADINIIDSKSRYMIAIMIDQYILFNEMQQNVRNMSYTDSYLNVTYLAATIDGEVLPTIGLSVWRDDMWSYSDIRKILRSYNMYPCNHELFAEMKEVDAEYIYIRKNMTWDTIGNTFNNITRTIDTMVKENTQSVILKVSPSIAYMLNISQFCRLMLIRSMTVIVYNPEKNIINEEYEDQFEYIQLEETQTDKILQLCMSTSNYISILNYVENPPAPKNSREIIFKPAIHLRLVMLDDELLTMEFPSNYVSEKSAPLFVFMMKMVEASMIWKKMKKQWKVK